MDGATFIIDDTGHAWAATDPRLARRLHSRIVGASLESYVMRNLGYIVASSRGLSCSVSFHLSTVSHLALVGAVYWLHDAELAHVNIELKDQPGVVPLVPSVKAACDYLLQLADARTPRAKVSAHAVPIQASPFSETWRLASHICTLAIGEQDRFILLNELFAGYFAIARLDVATGDYRIAALGAATRAADEDFARDSIGRTFREASDAEYGNAVANQLLLVPMVPEPNVTRIEARVNWPSRAPAIHRYSRLALPLLERNGMHRLLTATVQH